MSIVEHKSRGNDFDWAVKQLKLGSEIRRQHWDDLERRWYLGRGGVFLEETEYLEDVSARFRIHDMIATDWEIYNG